jgi:hypothetical protein
VTDCAPVLAAFDEPREKLNPPNNDVVGLRSVDEAVA